jgi:hypothetical protein
MHAMLPSSLVWQMPMPCLVPFKGMHVPAHETFRPAACRLVFVARGGTWSRATHHHWPDAFKAAARTLLLAGSRPSGAGRGACSGGGRLLPAVNSTTDREESPAPAGDSSCLTLAALPADALRLIVQLAAAPMSAWL